jgi:hypothetical protein
MGQGKWVRSAPQRRGEDNVNWNCAEEFTRATRFFFAAVG